MTAPLVVLAVPSGDKVHADFAMSLATLCLNPGARCCVVNAKTSLVPLGRNQCVGAAQLAGATHILFLDSDMVFPPDALKRLLAHQKDIVGAVYSQRTPPFHPLGQTLEGEHLVSFTGLRRMKIMPTGCLLIALSVFVRLAKPWFNLRAEGEKILGEDYYFCEKAREAGLEIWCDGDLSQELGHIGQAVYRLPNAALSGQA